MIVFVADWWKGERIERCGVRGGMRQNDLALDAGM